MKAIKVYEENLALAAREPIYTPVCKKVEEVEKEIPKPSVKPKPTSQPNPVPIPTPAPEPIPVPTYKPIGPLPPN